MQKSAIVTGGNSGIGFATAKKMKDMGIDVTITGRNKEKLLEASEKLGCYFQIADMSDIKSIANLAKTFKEKSLDYLVLNAAAAMFKPIQDTSLEDFNYFIDANIKGSYFLINWLLPSLKMSKGAVSVITSAIVDNGLPNASLYALTKGAMDSLVKSLSVELADQKVRVNAIAPGAVDTPILKKLGIPDEQMSAIRAQQEQMIPLKRYGQPEEIADAIISQLQNSYVTGATWEVDGGVNAI